jgi:signal transduction histidine kinase
MERTKEYLSGIRAFAQFLTGSKNQFTLENRIYNTVSLFVVITCLFYAVLSQIKHVTVDLQLSVVAASMQFSFYYLARFKNAFRQIVIPNSLAAYAIVIAVFFISDGFLGPSFLLLLYIFHLMVAFSGRKLRTIWLITHIITGLGLFYIQVFHAASIRNPYRSNLERYQYLFSAYIVAIVFVYVIMVVIINQYNQEREKTEAHLRIIASQHERLQSSQAILNTVVQGSFRGLVLMDSSTGILEYNKAALNFLDRQQIERQTTLPQYLKKEYRKHFFHGFLKARKGETLYEEVAVGDRCWFAAYEPAKDKDNNIIGVMLNLTDITDNKMKESHIRNINQAMAEIVQLQSHEVRRPLASILGLIDLYKEEPDNTYIELMEVAANDLDNVIKEIVNKVYNKTANQ